MGENRFFFWIEVDMNKGFESSVPDRPSRGKQGILADSSSSCATDFALVPAFILDAASIVIRSRVTDASDGTSLIVENVAAKC